jgi:hypothetical protein
VYDILVGLTKSKGFTVNDAVKIAYFHLYAGRGLLASEDIARAPL